jgi:Uma2 family endonuclease
MGTQADRLKLTYEDYRLLPDDGRRYELIDGDLVMSPSPKTRHQRILRNLFYALQNFLREHPFGEVFIAPYDVVLSEHDVCQPDLVFVAAAQASIITADNIRGSPALVIEILSEGNRKLDETIKLQRYEHFGIPEYWIIDPELDLMKIYRLTDGRYVRIGELTAAHHDTLTTPLLLDFTLQLATLFK